MKIELIKETALGKRDYYEVVLNGKSINGSYIKSEMEALYETIKKNPNLLKSRQEILLSEEIDVPLESESDGN